MIDNIYTKLYETYAKFSLKITDTFLFKNYGICLNPLNFLIELNYKEVSSQNELSCFEWQKALKALPKSFFLNTTITLTGRDPLFRDDFIEILNKASKKSFLKKKNIVKVETKGLLINNEIIESFIENKLHSLTILKSHKTTKEEFEKVKNNLLNLKNHYSQYLKYKPINIILEVKSEINKDNQEDILKDYEFLTNLGADKYIIIFDKNLENAIDEDSFNKIRAKIQKMKRYSKTKVDFIVKDDEIKKPCKYPNLTLIINPSGDIFNCLNCKMGNILQKSFNQLLKTLEYKEFLKNVKTSKRNFSICKNCTKN